MNICFREFVEVEVEMMDIISNKLSAFSEV
jgi:hypothetical protein